MTTSRMGERQFASSGRHDYYLMSTLMEILLQKLLPKPLAITLGLAALLTGRESRKTADVWTKVMTSSGKKSYCRGVQMLSLNSQFLLAPFATHGERQEEVVI